MSIERINQEMQDHSGKFLVVYLGDSINRRSQMRVLTTWTSKDPAVSTIYLISGDEAKSFAYKNKLRGVPAYMLFKDGQLIDTALSEISTDKLDQWFPNNGPLGTSKKEERQ